jgi:DNA polymerase I
MPKILLLDGNSLLYRGFFAMRVLTTSDGLPTNAIYSMTLMLLTAFESMKPDTVVCAFDAPVATFRHEAYGDYKGTRLRVPDELAAQRPMSRDLMRAFNISILENPGFEADDTIGTLAVKAQREGHSVVIVTGDLDALQLVDDVGPVVVMTTIKGVSETVVYDEARVYERYGLSPRQIPDYKALKGDSSDNLPGIPGIGDKTATKILKKYHTIEELVSSVHDIDDPKIRALVTTHGADAIRFKGLATIRRDVSLDGFEFDLDYRINGIDIPAATDLFERLEFRTLVKRLGKPKEATSKDRASTLLAAQPTDFGRPDSTSAATDRSTHTAVLLEFDVPNDKSDFLANTLMKVTISNGEVVTSYSLNELSHIKELLEDAALLKIVHDKKLAVGALAECGIMVNGVVFDTLLAAYLINPGRSSYKLPELISDYVGVAEPKDALETVSLLRDLQPVLLTKLSEAGLLRLHDEIELPLSTILAAMERLGVAIDVPSLEIASHTMGEQIRELETSIYTLADGEKFSIGSTKQLQYILFDKLMLPPGKKTKTGYSTDSEVLELLAAQGYEIASYITQWRELSKLKSTYADNFQALVSKRDGRIHTSLNQTVTATGRLSSSNPNLQNIPVRSEIGREIRKSFVAGSGKVLMAADYSQIELRIFAHITHDPELVRTFQSDEDIHRRTASTIFQVSQSDVTSEMRRRAKTINFAVIYGMSDFRLATELGIDVSTASAWKKRYFAEYPGVNVFAEEVLAGARQRGYVETLLGRRRYTPDINSRVFQFRQAAEREAVNMPVQGTAADIMKLAMIRVDQDLASSGLDANMTLQVHDELVFEAAPQDIAHLAYLVACAMENAYDLSVQLKVEVRFGRNWSEMTPIVDPLARNVQQVD